jgi:predicted ATPase with chaperone activity
MVSTNGGLGAEVQNDKPDFADIRGQEAAKRAMLIAIAGGHSIALVGPRGCGKSMLRTAANTFAESPLDIREIRSTNAIAKEMFEAFERHAETDIHIEVPSVPFRELVAKRAGTSSADFTRQIERMADAKKPPLPHELSETCKTLMKQAYDELGLTPGSVAVVIRVANTIARLDGSSDIKEQHIAEAVQYRLLDRKF